MTLHIRSEVPSDFTAINAVTQQAFLHAAHTDHNEHCIVAALRDAGALTLSLVAEIEGAVVGHLAVSPVAISDGAQGWYGLGPVSVKPQCKKQGIGSQLIHQALQTLRATGAAGCVVLGEPAYYCRFGFEHVPSLVLPDVPPQYFMLLAFGPATPQGMVTYHPAFTAKY